MAATPMDSGLFRMSERHAWTSFTGWSRYRRRWARSPRLIFGVLVAMSALIGYLSVHYPSWVATNLLVVPVLAGAALLPMRWLVAFAVLAAAVFGVAVEETQPQGEIGARLLAFFVVLIMALAGARVRTRLGVIGSQGESMLLERRERLTTTGELPGLPGGWRAEVVHRSAHGESFSGDFVASALSPDETHLEIVLVDVSGNGFDAGTRALLLSGAFAGLLGSVPPERLLPAANLYLLRQRWPEGFATGVYLSIDLRTGAFQLGSAGHPPAVQFHAGSGGWEVGGASGPAFGLVEDAGFELVSGQLLPGDAMLLYTDGLVEKADRDISVGLDRLLGEAERLVAGGFESGANRLMLALSDTETDDRACALICLA